MSFSANGDQSLEANDVNTVTVQDSNFEGYDFAALDLSDVDTIVVKASQFNGEGVGRSAVLFEDESSTTVNFTFINNFVFNHSAASVDIVPYSIYASPYSSPLTVKIYNNSFYDNKYSIDLVGSQTIKNNAIYSTLGQYAFDGTTYTATLTSDFNLYYGPLNYSATNLTNWRTLVGGEASSFVANPQFTSATNLHLQSTSSAIGAGVSLLAVLEDIDGDARPYFSGGYDIGADEY